MFTDNIPDMVTAVAADIAVHPFPLVTITWYEPDWVAVYEVPVWPEIADPLKYHWFPDVALEFNTEPLCVMVGVVGTA